jgi:hypothetical protein
MVYAQTKQTTLIVERGQAKAQLQLLGYQLGDSQKFLDNRDATRLSRIGKAELAKLNEWGQV